METLSRLYRRDIFHWGGRQLVNAPAILVNCFALLVQLRQTGGKW
jgi:hypothetical protein